ncbi:hypothetical protein GCM10008908_34960 [Clostridium subterminale]|uniref:Uncharacterized protein n=1 Tax=Clostridium subterminale TaxID=1550 RepID=A0ABN1KXE1_CLOSU
MKKFTVMLLILITLTFSASVTTHALAKNLFTEGSYKLSDFVPSKNNSYFVQNIASEGNCYFAVMGKNDALLQVIHLTPKSPKYNLIRLEPEYKIFIIGDGEVYVQSVQ